MKAIEFDQVNKRIAEDQPEYLTLPVCQVGSLVTMCFEFNEQELQQIRQTGCIWFSQHLGGLPLFPPIEMSCLNPFEDQTITTYWVYDNPPDYPGKWVVRKWTSTKGVIKPADTPLCVADTLDECRAVMPVGLNNLGRQHDDDICIHEVWL